MPSAGTVVELRANLPDWEGPFPLAGEVSRLLGVPVCLGNDVQVATDAEFRLGAGRPYRSLIGVFWGTGVGGGIVLDGRPWVGAAPRGRSATWWSSEDGRRARAGGADAWRPTRAAPRWR